MKKICKFYALFLKRHSGPPHSGLDVGLKRPGELADLASSSAISSNVSHGAPMSHPTFTHHRGQRTAAAAAVLLIAGITAFAAPAQAQRCFNQNGQTICCDNSGNCYSR